MDELPGAPHAEAAKQWGVVTELFVKPLSTLAQAKAEAYAIKTKSNAQIAATECEERARRRRTEDELRWQENLDAIAAKAVAMLPDTDETTERDPDWFSRFTENAKHSSDQDARTRWAKILAGEIIHPGTYSPRLLQTLSTIKKSEARQFEVFCNYVWRDCRRRRFLLYTERTLNYLRAQIGITENTYDLLRELGFVISRGVLPNLQADQTDYLCYGSKAYSFMAWKAGADRPVMIELTTLGKELMDICDPEFDEEYLERVAGETFCLVAPPPNPWPWPDVKPAY